MLVWYMATLGTAEVIAGDLAAQPSRSSASC